MNTDRFLAPIKAVMKSAGNMPRFISLLRHRYLQGMPDLASPPDVDSLFVTLEVEKRACHDGGNNLPPISDEVISGAQRDIVDHHRKLHNGARRKVERLATRLHTEARRINPVEVKDCLRHVPSKVQNKIDRVRAEYDSKLALLQSQEEYNQQYLAQQDEQARDEDSGGAATKVFILAIMLAIASLASLALGSNILWGADSRSLLGTEAAIAIALIAVLVPFQIAVFVGKPINVIRHRKRFVFRLAMVLTTAFLGLFAFSCAHLIMASADAAAVGTADFSAAMNTMTSDPGAFRGDANALRGFGVVVLSGILGFVLGNLSIDSMADEDAIRAAHLNARVDRERLARQVRKQVNRIVDAAERDIERSANRLHKRFRNLSALVERAGDTQAKYDDYLAGLEESCNLLLERYRQANATARNTAIPPSFFEQISFTLEGACRKSFFEDGIERHRQAAIEMKKFSETVATVRRDLWKINKDTIQSLGSVEVREDADESLAYT